MKKRILVSMILFTGLTLAISIAMQNYFFCNDPMKPCAGETEARCPDCSSKVTQRAASLPNIMKDLNLIYSALQKHTLAGNGQVLREIHPSVILLARLISNTTPKKNKDKLDEFRNLAGKLTDSMNGIAKSVDINSKGLAVIEHTKMGDVCKACHVSFR